jgi:hypothetical protein
MRVSRQGAAFLALAAVLLPVGSAAYADELLVMPYACSVVGGQPLLTPGPEQSHRIIGKRDQRKFTACSPVNPGICRHWNVHRFDLDCDGTRVSWVSVVAATNEGSRRAWLLDGRLLLRMGAWWSLAPDDPCAREPGPDERFAHGGRLRRQCAERLALAPPPVVEMPFGYAPMLGIDGIFVTAAPPPPGVAAAPPKLPPIVAGTPSTKSAAADAKPQVAPQPAPKVASPAQPASAAAPAAQERAKHAIPKPAPKVAAAAPPAPAKEATPGSQGPRLVTPPAPAALVAPQSPPPPKVAAPATSPTPEVQKKTVAAEPRAGTADATPLPKAAVTTSAEPEAAFSLSLFRTTTTGAIVAFAGLTLGLLTAFALARRREHARDAGRPRRDIAGLSLDGTRARAQARAGDPRGRPAPNARVKATANPAPSTTAAARGRSVAPSRVADRDDRMPRTREEALKVLGIGIAPSATETAIKKIVDGLRMSWHPDLAKDETDRALRELRSKQINAAWDLLQAQRAEA